MTSAALPPLDPSAASAGAAPTGKRPGVTAQRVPLALAVLALFGWLLWSVSARQALLLLVGVGLGWGLAAARFGFTTGWRHLVELREPDGVYGQLLLLAVLAALSMPMLAFFPETTAALGPPSFSLLIGAFVFGIAMQITDGCGSGTLYKAGLGVPLNMAILPVFTVGSFMGSVHLNNWLALGATEPVGLVTLWGWVPALAATLAALALVAVAVRRWCGRPSVSPPGRAAGCGARWCWRCSRRSTCS